MRVQIHSRTKENLRCPLECALQGPEVAGRAVARLPTTAVRFQSQVRTSWICDGQNDTGAGFLLIFHLPVPILVLPTARHTSSPPCRPNSGRPARCTQSRLSPRKKIVKDILDVVLRIPQSVVCRCLWNV